MTKIYKLNYISHYLCYTIEDICNLYKNRKLHPQTVRNWIKNGLETVDNRIPMLIHGTKLKEFLSNMNEKNRHKLEFEEFYCLSCKEAHIPLHRKIFLEQNRKFIVATGICPKTKKLMKKSYKFIDYLNLKKFFNLVELSRLYDSLNTTLKTQSENDTNPHRIELEPEQKEFYL